ncbi:hypothetical protein BCG9842_B2477 [Bacillus cereus G9842]|uniref:Uncharacterized protein n=1 Tax=Bacillus cereus (strain G9842) TaxID=405531 RepID=B7IJM8_BACC2|nr:hypothetical protein BCG9842_B2477 [Bacillus cereus G9842]
MKRNLKTSTIIILILTIIALEVGIALSNHNLSLDTIYFAAILICIVLLFGTRVSEKKVNRNEGEEKQLLYFGHLFYCLSLVSQL